MSTSILALRGPYPQPARGLTSFSLRLQTGRAVVARLYDARGRRVIDVFDGQLSAGQEHVLPLDTSDLAPGMYFLKVEGDSFEQSRKVAVLR